MIHGVKLAWDTGFPCWSAGMCPRGPAFQFNSLWRQLGKRRMMAEIRGPLLPMWRDPDNFPYSWLQSDLALTVTGIWGVNLDMKDHIFSLLYPLSITPSLSHISAVCHSASFFFIPPFQWMEDWLLKNQKWKESPTAMKKNCRNGSISGRPKADAGSRYNLEQLLTSRIRRTILVCSFKKKSCKM